MRATLAGLTLAFCAMVVRPGFAQSAAPQPCPISYSKLSMPYNHDGGTSTPTVQLSFMNDTAKKIVRAKFGLLVIGPEGNIVPYEHDLTFSSGAEPGKIANSEWRLKAEEVDIHRLGETIYLKSVRFVDDSAWQDDGHERCKNEVYYGPK